jgi:hypothetical protein
VHRPAILVGFLDFNARAPNSSTGMFNRRACDYKNDPVPAAHSVFIA